MSAAGRCLILQGQSEQHFVNSKAIVRCRRDGPGAGAVGGGARHAVRAAGGGHRGGRAWWRAARGRHRAGQQGLDRRRLLLQGMPL